MDRALDHSNCPLCGGLNFKRRSKVMTLERKGKTKTIEQIGMWCNDCGEGVIEPEDMKATRREIGSFMGPNLYNNENCVSET